MIPRVELDLDPSLPPDSAFWTPEPEDLASGGLGFFDGVWIIDDSTIDDATRLLEVERDLVELAAAHAQDAETFDAIAMAIEYCDCDVLPEGVAASASESLIACVDDDIPALEGLELGVAGLSHALSSVGIPTAASCRGHAVLSLWSPYPVVYAAVGESEARRLAKLVARSGCGFCIDPERSEFLVIRASSITDTMELARLVLDM
jgi:hypothetical protein